MSETLDYKSMTLDEKRARLAEIAAKRRLEVAPSIGRSACDMCVFAAKCAVRNPAECDGGGNFAEVVQRRDYKQELADPKKNIVMAQPKPRPVQAKPRVAQPPKRVVPKRAPGESIGEQIAEMMVATFSFGAMKKRAHTQRRAAPRAA